MKSTSTRCALLDELRGLDLISMMLYHGMWDLVYLFGVRAPWYGSWQGELWQQSICWVFILLSGFCLPLGRHPVKRGAVVFGCGALVTAVTLIFMPADAVWFGVLTLLGSAMIITGLLEKWMEKVPPVVGLAGSFFLFYFTRHAADGYLQLGHWLITPPGFLYANYFTAYLGFYPFGFFSADYFPLIPWLFLFWTGFYLYHLVGKERLEPLHRSVCPPLGCVSSFVNPYTSMPKSLHISTAFTISFVFPEADDVNTNDFSETYFLFFFTKNSPAFSR